MDKWSELRTVYHVAKLGTVSKAAEALDMHRATVNRHIDMIESDIGGRVFIRHARGYTLTELGQEVLQVAERTTEMLDNLTGRVNGANALIDGEVLLTLVPQMSVLVVDGVAQFRAQNPKCRVTIHGTYDLVKLEYGEAHVALRAGPKPDYPDYVVRHFKDLRFSLYGHDSYLRRHGAAAGPEDLDRHMFILPPRDLTYIPFQGWIDDNVRQDQIAVIANSPPFHFQAVQKGIGLGFLPDFEVENDPAFNAVLTNKDDWFIPLWLVTHVDVHRTDKIQSFLQALTDQDNH
ncbi:LysR family transcriptional regulator [Tateyamaria sp. SN3-11]|uniref:LysR family transcriptional regulator n=1 Tax=Tateyamaria sp. SN3-11 TaxID=3092147 RepID=UPI0039EA1ED6